MIYVYDGKNYALGEYQNAFKKVFKDELKDGKNYNINDLLKPSTDIWNKIN